jgi:hypothetical protein
MSRTTTTALIAILIASSITIIQLTSAASAPSVPEFTVKQVDRSYDVPTTYSTNQYTGETITNPGYHVQNRTIDVIIKNQPFSPSTVEGNTTGLFYNVQAKGSFEDWSNSLYSDSHNKYAFAASTSGYTIVTIIMGSDGWYPSDGSQVDIRAQAVTGYSYYVWSLGGGPIPIGTQFRLLAASDWSNTQTITIGSGNATTSQPTMQPTQNPAETPIQPSTQPDVMSGLTWKDAVIVVACAVIVALAVALVLSRKRRA